MHLSKATQINSESICRPFVRPDLKKMKYPNLYAEIETHELNEGILEFPDVNLGNFISAFLIGLSLKCKFTTFESYYTSDSTGQPYSQETEDEAKKLSAYIRKHADCHTYEPEGDHAFKYSIYEGFDKNPIYLIRMTEIDHVRNYRDIFVFPTINFSEDFIFNGNNPKR